jgi:hypothetical protein
VKKCSAHSLRKCSQIPKNSQTLDFDLYWQCRGWAGKDNQREIKCCPIQTHTATTVSSGYCIIRLFSVDWKPSLNGENIMGKMNYMNEWTKFWQVSQSKWSKRSLSTGWIDSNVWLMQMVTPFPKMAHVNFWTELNNGKHVRISHSWITYSSDNSCIVLFSDQ